MTALSWAQVHAWRLSQHALLARAERRKLLEVVSQIGGLQAQLMSAAELALWARVQDISPADVQRALWRDRTLAKTWAMRGTLHLLPATDFPLYVAALSAYRYYQQPSWLKYYGVSPAELEAIIEGVRTTLDGSPVTRAQLAEAVARRTRQPKWRELLSSGWGSLLKPSAFQGHLCFGPSQGQHVTFVRPDTWLGDWRPAEPAAAMQELARRYLTAYGPASIDDFAHWSGLKASEAKQVWRDLADEVAPVEVEGWRAWALTATLKRMRAAKAPPSVRLLPYFDPYVVAVSRHAHNLLPEGQRPRVYRPQGWISPVVLIDGRIAGVWAYGRLRAQVSLRVEMFAPPTRRIKQGIEAEAERLGAFLEADVKIAYAD